MALKSVKRLILSIDGAETNESNAGFRRHFNYEKLAFLQNF
jgi:hypothetical protein